MSSSSSSYLPPGLIEALSANWRSIKMYRVKERIKVPRCARDEEGKFSWRNSFNKGKIVFARWDATWPNLIEVEYPSRRYTVIFQFTIRQWKVIKRFLELLEK